MLDATIGFECASSNTARIPFGRRTVSNFSARAEELGDAEPDRAWRASAGDAFERAGADGAAAPDETFKRAGADGTAGPDDAFARPGADRAAAPAPISAGASRIKSRAVVLWDPRGIGLEEGLAKSG